MNKIITAALLGAGISVSVTALPPTLPANVILRDFSTVAGPFYNPNFEKPGPISGLETGIVLGTKGAGPVPPTFVGPGVSTGPSSVTTAAAFNQWWSAGVDGAPGNAPFGDTLTLNLASTIGPQFFGALYGTVGVYHFSDTTFFPMDGAVGSNPLPPTTAGGFYGNEGRTHNYGFTMEYHSSFTFFNGFSFTFNGDDDLWVYIDNKLALDLGGVHPPTNGAITSADPALAGLVPGTTYDFDLYFAERHTNASDLTFDITVFEEQTLPEANTFAPSLALLAGIGATVLRRRQKAA